MIEDIKIKAAEIRDERDPAENTALRVGECLVNLAEQLKTNNEQFLKLTREIATLKNADYLVSIGVRTDKERIIIESEDNNQFGHSSLIPAATIESAGAMSAADKKLVSKITDIERAANGAYGDIHIEISDTAFIATFSDKNETIEKEMRIDAATTQKAGLMSAKDKENLDKIFGDVLKQKSPLIVGRAIPTKARKGQRYYFQSGVPKIKVLNPNHWKNKHLSQEKKEALNAIIQKLKAEGAEICPADTDTLPYTPTIVFQKIPHGKPGDTEYFFGPGTITEAVIATVKSDNWPITFEDLELDYISRDSLPYSKTASPFLYLRNGIVHRTKTICLEDVNRILAESYMPDEEFNELETEYNENPESGRPSRIIYRKFRNRVKFTQLKRCKLRHAYLTNRLKRTYNKELPPAGMYKKIWRTANKIQSNGLLYRAFFLHRGRRCPEYVEFYMSNYKTKHP